MVHQHTVTEPIQHEIKPCEFLNELLNYDTRISTETQTDKELLLYFLAHI